MRAISPLLSFLVLAAFAGCAFVAFRPQGDLLFSYCLMEGAFSGVPKQATGVFLFREKAGSIMGYRLKNGRELESFGGGTFYSERLERQLEQIAFEPFNFDAEIARVDRELLGGAPGVITLDGGEYEIRYVFNHIDYTLKGSNPGAKIEFYATHSKKIAKLKAVVDLFAAYYGRSKFE